MLYPIDTSTRICKDLNGIWNFALDPEDRGTNEGWYEESKLPAGSIRMPVPASYNDITTDASIRDYVGSVWYQREFFVPANWKGQSVRLRFGAISHKARVFCNGKEIAYNKGGFLPFEIDVSQVVSYQSSNSLYVQVDNMLDWTTLPPGKVHRMTEEDGYDKPVLRQEYFHDFFNFSGIHRPVRLICVPHNGLEDITVATKTCDCNSAYLELEAETKSENVLWELFDDSGDCVALAKGKATSMVVKNPNLWEPGAAYLYNMRVTAQNHKEDTIDSYELPVGIRSIKVTQKEFFINDKPFYFKGFGKHEDADIIGKGLDEAINVRDFNLMRWINANSFRTSHYPYAEEIMRLADREGIVIINEVPAVGLYDFSAGNPSRNPIFIEEKAGTDFCDHHKECLERLVKRDKNNPSVVMWSLGNETATHEDAAVVHYQKLYDLVKDLDPEKRPITIVEYNFAQHSKIGHIVDVHCFNRYYGWYFDTGRLDAIERKLRAEIERWYNDNPKPIICTEFGADCEVGMRSLPSTMFSEEFQVEYIDAFCRVFDDYDFFIGEHVWNFADFATKQGLTRFIGNKKGVFTRQRQPKSIAHYLKKRWERMA